MLYRYERGGVVNQIICKTDTDADYKSVGSNAVFQIHCI